MEAYDKPLKKGKRKRVLSDSEELKESKRRRITFIKDKISKRLQLTEKERKDFEAYKKGRRESRRESETVEYQDESPMPSMRGDKRSFDEIIKEGRRPRKARVNMTLDEEAEEWLERVAKHNRKRRRPPYNKSSVANKIILEHKATVVARARARKREK